MTDPISVLVDTDVALDDWMAILYLLVNPGVKILGITTTGVGAAHLTPGTSIVQSLLLVGGQPDVPVAKGTSAPLRYSNVFPGDWRALVDKAYGLTLPQSQTPVQAAPAVQFLQDTILGASSPVTLLSIGGGTNLGTLFQQASSETMAKLRANISSIVMMGGVINQVGDTQVPGNVNSFNPDYLNTVAEWNIFIDVLGASLVFASGIPITLIPLNASNQVPLDMNFYGQLENFIAQRQNFVPPRRAAGVRGPVQPVEPLDAPGGAILLLGSPRRDGAHEQRPRADDADAAHRQPGARRGSRHVRAARPRLGPHPPGGHVRAQRVRGPVLVLRRDHRRRAPPPPRRSDRPGVRPPRALTGLQWGFRRFRPVGGGAGEEVLLEPRSGPTARSVP